MKKIYVLFFLYFFAVLNKGEEKFSTACFLQWMQAAWFNFKDPIWVNFLSFDINFKIKLWMDLALNDRTESNLITYSRGKIIPRYLKTRTKVGKLVLSKAYSGWGSSYSCAVAILFLGGVSTFESWNEKKKWFSRKEKTNPSSVPTHKDLEKKIPQVSLYKSLNFVNKQERITREWNIPPVPEATSEEYFPIIDSHLGLVSFVSVQKKEFPD